MKFPIDTKVYAIFGGEVNKSYVRAQSRQYKEFMRLHIFDNMKVINGHEVPMIIDLHPDDVYENRTTALKVLFERKLKGRPENTRYSLED